MSSRPLLTKMRFTVQNKTIYLLLAFYYVKWLLTLKSGRDTKIYNIKEPLKWTFQCDAPPKTVHINIHSFVSSMRKKVPFCFQHKAWIWGHLLSSSQQTINILVLCSPGLLHTYLYIHFCAMCLYAYLHVLLFYRKTNILQDLWKPSSVLGPSVCHNTLMMPVWYFIH